MSWRFGECELDRAKRELNRGTRCIPLTPKALRLFELLLERNPTAVSRQEIRDRFLERVQSTHDLSDGEAIRLGAVHLLFRSLPLEGSTASERG